MKSIGWGGCGPAARTGAAALALVALWLGTGAALAAEEVPATLQWARRVTLSTLVAGTVSAVPAQVGARVKKGAALVKLDPRRFDAALEEAKARVESTTQKNKEAQRELERAQELYDRTVLSDRELQLARIGAASAAADYRAAQAALVQAQLDKEYSTVTAPFDALVLAVPAEVGEVIVAELKPEPLVTIAASDRMLARFVAQETQLARLQSGQAVQVEVDGRRYRGAIRDIGLEPTGSGGYPVDVSFATGDRVLRAGRHATVHLP